MLKNWFKKYINSVTDPGSSIPEETNTLTPDDAEEHYRLGLALQDQGQREQAITHYQQALALKPDHAQAYNNLGNTYLELKQFEQAIDCYQHAFSLKPDYAEAYNNLGLTYLMQRQPEAALAQFKQAIALKPEFAQAYHNLGYSYHELEQLEEAVRYYKQAITLMPDEPGFHQNLGHAFQNLGKFEEAVNQYQQVLTLNPDYADTYNDLGIVLQHQYLLTEAENTYKKALELNPNSAEIYNNLGQTYQSGGKSTKAIHAFEKALELKPDFASVYNNLGITTQNQGKIKQAIAHYQHALSLKPDNYSTHSNLLFCINYSHEINPEKIFNEHKQWEKHHTLLHTEKIMSCKNNPDPNRKLRVGYISADFRYHSVAYFIASVFSEYNRDAFETIIYSNTIKQDDMTERLRDLVDVWRNIVGMTDKQVAELIAKDQIDILVDLAGHTSGNRLRVFTLRPAAIQISYLGYPNTTGVTAIDYRLTDAYADPPGMTEDHFTETLIRLPHSFLCYMPPQDCLNVNDLPAMRTGQFTFGCFNTSAKLNAEIIAIWSKILRKLPGARLLLKANYCYNDTAVQQYFMNIFKQHGVLPEQITFNNYLPVYEHLDLYNEVDIALDTFPYNGTTTTCEALWMGVPVITLAGHTHRSRVSSSILSNIGFPQFIAKTPDDFVDIAISLSQDLETLAEIRKNLRSKMQQSPITNARLLTNNLEKIYRDMWSAWCHDTKI